MTYYDEDGNIFTDYSEQNIDNNTDIVSDDAQTDIPTNEIIEEEKAENTENDDFFKDVIKMLIQNKNDDLAEDDTNSENVHDSNSEEVPELAPDPRNDSSEEVSSGNVIDYTNYFGDIISRQDNIIENQEYLIAVSDDNNINSPLESQSATNILLMVVIVILLTNILVKFIRGLF